MAERLEINSSQQAAWEEFAKSVEAMAERDAKKPDADADADAATISRYRADRANQLAAKLNRIADATAKLQAALNEDQRKILNRASHRFLHDGHAWGHEHGGQMHEDCERKWGQHEGAGSKARD